MNSYIASLIRTAWCLLQNISNRKIYHNFRGYIINLKQEARIIESSHINTFIQASPQTAHDRRPLPQNQCWRSRNDGAQTNLACGGVWQPTIPYQFIKSFLFLAQWEVLYGTRKARLAVLWTVYNYNLGTEQSITHDATLQSRLNCQSVDLTVLLCHATEIPKGDTVDDMITAKYMKL